MHPTVLPIGITMGDLIERIAKGARLAELQAYTGIDYRQLSRMLLTHPDYPDAKACALEARLDSVEASFAAPDCDIPRVREQAKMAMWRAEREAPGRWGAKVEVKADMSLTVHVNRAIIEADDAAQ